MGLFVQVDNKKVISNIEQTNIKIIYLVLDVKNSIPNKFSIVMILVQGKVLLFRL